MRKQTSTDTGPLFIGDNLALDFINTSYGTGAQHRDCLDSDRGVLDWLEAASLLPAGVDAAPQGLLSLALELRQGARALVEAARSAGEADPAIVNRVLEMGSCHSALEWDASIAKFVRRTRQRGMDAAGLLAPVAEALVQLLVDAGVDLVRQCEGDECSLLFRDITKSHRRRWCSMTACGNRMKVAAFRARQKTE